MPLEGEERFVKPKGSREKTNAGEREVIMATFRLTYQRRQWMGRGWVHFTAFSRTPKKGVQKKKWERGKRRERAKNQGEKRRKNCSESPATFQTGGEGGPLEKETVQDSRREKVSYRGGECPGGGPEPRAAPKKTPKWDEGGNGGTYNGGGFLKRGDKLGTNPLQ